MADFLPRRDAALVDWTRNFSQMIQHDPTQYGLTAVQAADYAALQQDYAQAYRQANEPMTRGLRTVLVKDETRRAVVEQTRVLARRVRAQPGVTGVELYKLGLVGPGAGDEGDSVQQAQGPRLKVVAPGRCVKVSVRRYEGGRKRPADAVGAAVYWFVGERTPGELSEWHLAGNTTRPEMSFVLPVGAAEPGAKLWVVGAWLDRKLQPGRPGMAEYTAVGYGLALAA